MVGKNYKELLVWQKAMDLVEEVYVITRMLPEEEKYALGDQMRRSAVSIPSNIAEGNARGTEKEMIHFLYIAQGSRAELETQLELSYRVGYTLKERIIALLELSHEVGRMLTGLIKSLKSNIQHPTSNV